MAPGFGPPPLIVNDHLWPADELVALAVGWLDAIRASVPRAATLTALPLANHPDAVALLFALSTLPWPVVVLPADPRAWRSGPPLPAATPIFLPPSLASLASTGEALGYAVVALPHSRPPSAATPPRTFLATPGFVNFTSGSTGLPKPVYISTRSFLVQTASIVQACRLSPGDAVAGSLPLSTHYGLGQSLLVATVLGSPLGLLERFDHRSLLNLFARRRYTYWAGTPLMADVLGRAAVRAPRPDVPRICHISAGRLTTRVFRAFRERFGVPPRPNYGQTENGFITADTAPDDEVRPESVGRAAPGIDVRVGDDPHDPFPPGRLGRVWFTSPWYMDGYGFPPDLVPREGRQGWWPTHDLGQLDASGCLTLAGRVDDCFKTTSGYLVNPGEITSALMSHPGVRDIIVMPVATRVGPTIGALVETEGAVDPAELRAAAARSLPSWLRPDILVVTRQLPRLAGGKIDRAACRAVLDA